MITRNKWVLWRYETRQGKQTKAPYNPNIPDKRASSKNPMTWSTYENAMKTKAMVPGMQGIGYVFDGSGHVFVDFDHIRDKDTGEIDPDALAEIKSLNSYSEVSPSGTGVHVICKGALPGNKGCKGATREVYSEGRYATVTGDHLPGTPLTINDAQPAIDKFLKRWFPNEQTPTPAAGPGTARQEPPALEDQEIVALARAAKNGEKFSALLRGSTAGYNSPSEADSALCCMLAFYTRNPRQIDRIYRCSGLKRQKWDVKHGTDTYGNITIQNAINTVKKVYTQRAPGRNTGNGYGTEKRIAQLRDVADIIHDRMHVIAVSKSLFFYDDGIYKYNTGQIEREIQNVLKDIEYVGKITEAKREVKSFLTGMDWYEEPPFNKWEGYIPTRDCVLHLTDNGVDVLPHDPKYLFTYKLGAKYDPDVDTAPLLKVFNEWVDEEDVKYLIQLPAQAIAQAWGDCFKLAYLFEGTKNAGKTIYFNLLDMFIGKENRCAIPLHTLVSNRFAAIGLIGKLANVVDELPSVDLKNLDTFKSMVGGGAIRVERKGEDAYTATPTAVHCFNCNVPPTCKISDEESWWIRWVYARFISVFPVNPAWKREFLTDTNVSALLKLVLPELQQIRRSGEVYRMDPDEVKRVWTESSDILIKFMADSCERDPLASIPKDEFFDAFVVFCSENKRPSISKTAVTQILGRLHIPVSRPLVSGARIYAYHGLKWKDGKKPESLEKPGQVGQKKLDDSDMSNLSNFSETSKADFKQQINCENNDLKYTKEFEKSWTTQTPDSPQTVDNGEPGSWDDLLKKYDLPIDLDITGHQKFTRSGHVCNCSDCGKPGSLWHGEGATPRSLCDTHYKELMQAWQAMNEGKP